MTEPLSAESTEAVHKAKNAAQAVEVAREAQMQDAIMRSAEETKKATIEALKEVFGESDTENPQQMKVLVRRIPILCTNIANMHHVIENMSQNQARMSDDQKRMTDNQTWVTRAIIGGVIAGVLALVFNLITK